MIQSSLSTTTTTNQKLKTPYRNIGVYNPIEAKEYFDERPQTFIKRFIEVAIISTSFGLKYLLDYLTNKTEEPSIETERATELRELLVKLGPTFIKIGQSLSIRTDLLRPAYIKSLTELQDKVESFPTTIARDIIQSEFGISPDELFSNGLDVNDKTIAAASLGQVFKATLKDGRTVAVKVQRPKITEQIALDMHLLRTISPIFRDVFQLNSDLEGIVDNWGKGFVAEISYIQEAKNAESFMETISKTPLKDIVFAPPVIKEFSSERVLTTLWIDGENLNFVKSDDIGVLCSVAMNTYLTMLLEGGLLHSDPHYGNLKRTKDGKLCILDWGLTTSINKDLQLTLIEHVAHLVSKDYAQVPSDLVKLGFVPEGKQDIILEKGVVEVLADIYGKWAKGGGVQKIDINQVVKQLQGLVDDYGNLFQLPPYFAYIARAFAILEGIGLKSDPDYSILNECLPYISQRLLSDPNSKTGEALKTFMFGSKKDSEYRTIDVERIDLLLKGYEKYSTSSTFNLSVEEATEKLVDLLLGNSEQNTITPVQQLLLEEVAKISGANARSLWTRIRQQSGILPNGRTLLGTAIDPFAIFSGSKLLEVDEYDKNTLETTSALVNVINQNLRNANVDVGNITPQQANKILNLLRQKLWQRRLQVVSLSGNFFSLLLKQTADRIDKSPVSLSSPSSSSSSSVNSVTVKIDKPITTLASTTTSESDRLVKARQMISTLSTNE